MQKLLVIATLFFSINSFATTVEITNCEAQSQSHRLLLTNTSEGVEVRFEGLSFDTYPDTGRSPSYKVTGRNVTIRTIHGISLQEISRKSSLLKEPIVSILSSRSEFDGEADMYFAYANDYINSLNCK
ncbi:hypothetical protein D3C87_1315360 [compost metagenome]